MSNIILRSIPARQAVARRAIGSTTFIRTKVTLPDLPYDYGALEPAISGKIMELHHKNHHQTYVNGFNDAQAKLSEAIQKEDVKAQIALKPLINFHGGGHLNHSLFWEGLAPAKNGGGGEPEGPLAEAIKKSYGGFEEFKTASNAALAGIQGSGWLWAVKSPTGDFQIITTANQDHPSKAGNVILGIDAWEHAYYLQYQNRKADYFKAIWDVINWKKAEERWR